MLPPPAGSRCGAAARDRERARQQARRAHSGSSGRITWNAVPWSPRVGGLFYYGSGDVEGLKKLVDARGWVLLQERDEKRPRVDEQVAEELVEEQAPLDEDKLSVFDANVLALRDAREQTGRVLAVLSADAAVR